MCETDEHIYLQCVAYINNLSIKIQRFAFSLGRFHGQKILESNNW